MKNSVLKNNKGFSMVELMVVASIIGILAFVAIPAYKGFLSRARQKEGFTLMSSYYSAAQATYSEFGLYPGDFVQTAFQPAGALAYRIHAADGTLIPTLPNDDACFRTDALPCDCGGACANYPIWNETVGALNTALGAVACNMGTGCGAPVVNDANFTILACGVIDLNAATIDQYSIDEQKTITMCLDGSK